MVQTQFLLKLNLIQCVDDSAGNELRVKIHAVKIVVMAVANDLTSFSQEKQ